MYYIPCIFIVNIPVCQLAEYKDFPILRQALRHLAGFFEQAELNQMAAQGFEAPFE